MKAGGSYVKVLERPVKVTHLLCGNASDAESEKVRYAEKFNSMGEARIHIVWEDWFWDSLRFGGRFDEDAYKVSNPPPPPRALPDGKIHSVAMLPCRSDVSQCQHHLMMIHRYKMIRGCLPRWSSPKHPPSA